MSPVGVLLDRTLRSYSARWRPLVAIMAIELAGRYALMVAGAAAVFLILLGGLDGAAVDQLQSRFSDIEFWAQHFFGLAAIVLVFSAALALFEAWVMTALFYAAERPAATVGEALRGGLTHLVPFGWVLTLASLLVTAGLFLLVIPGLILSVLFFLAPHAYFAEGRTGYDALRRARECVSARLGDSSLRLGLGWTLFTVAIVVLGQLRVPMAGDLVVLVGFPWLVLYQSELFRELSAASPAKPAVEFP
ncbi:MAG: hypothetical protein HY553_00085 [Elusimicrobia bacterium]|nr:hypothetical protein [Elusimicrobiota bacterium]